MDKTDDRILEELSGNGRATVSEISRRVNLSVPAVAERIRKLEEAGIIEGYAAKISRSKSGYKLLVFITIVIDRPENVENFRKSIDDTSSILECHHIAGPYDYLLKVLVEDTAALEALIGGIKNIRGVMITNTAVVLSTLKEKVNRC
ncbi:MAG: Lrp/AsnC family transcriptional regulator [Clostridia bacterium]|nr:Lrp/AsnC family transcriptional regulator [Clostridia bacterium]